MRGAPRMKARSSACGRPGGGKSERIFCTVRIVRWLGLKRFSCDRDPAADRTTVDAAPAPTRRVHIGPIFDAHRHAVLISLTSARPRAPCPVRRLNASLERSARLRAARLRARRPVQPSSAHVPGAGLRCLVPAAGTLDCPARRAVSSPGCAQAHQMSTA